MAIKFPGIDPQLRHLRRVLDKKQLESIVKARKKKPLLNLKGIRNDKK